MLGSQPPTGTAPAGDQHPWTAAPRAVRFAHGPSVFCLYRTAAEAGLYYPDGKGRRRAHGPARRPQAMDLLKADPARRWRVADVARACGTAPRTLQKHFRQFVGRSLGEVWRELRLHHARHELLRARDQASVTDVGLQYGLGNLG